MSRTAQTTREDKVSSPWKYCGVRVCLWRVIHRDGSVTPCKNHPNVSPPPKPEVAA